MPLTERRAQILRFIVDQYIKDALPVASAALTRYLPLSLSPATIRNEMATLEEEGFITHPHTSAGRIPLDKGYRYYVEALMQEEELGEDQKRMIRHQFHQAERDLETWMDLAVTALARLVRNLALVVPPRPAHVSLRQLDLVRIHDLLALLVMVLHEARIKQWLVPLEPPLQQEELDALAQRLNRILVGLTARQMRQLTVELSPLEEELRQAVIAALESEDAVSADAPYLDGVRQMLSQPEFRQHQQLLAALEVLDERNLSQTVPLMAMAGSEGVQVVIGHENPGDALHSYSVIISRYGAPGGAQGAVGVLGPTRMAYYRTIPVVRYMSSLLSELTSYYYG